jgi:tellurite resistance protein TehA-like permease
LWYWWQSSEELILPSDKTWPFLLRFPVSAFGMCLGMSSQAILWKRIAISASTRFLHITVKINLVLWCVSVALMLAVSALYACKLVFYFEAVRREYYHPIRVNFFFAPWIACLFLAIGVPDLVAATLPHWLWYVLMAPIVCLELKIYGQWISGGQRRLSRVANPSNHLSIVGNFVGALLGGIMGLKEGPMFFFAVGLAHYIVLFVTLYQRLPTSETLPRDLHPVFFLFVAAPSVACLAWARITGEFGYGSRVAYFIHVPVRIAGRAHQPVPRVQLLAGVVGLHVPDDQRGHRVHPILVGGEECVHAVHVHRPVRGGDAGSGGALPHHGAARGGAPRPLPQRHLYRHHGAPAQQAPHRGEDAAPPAHRRRQQEAEAGALHRPLRRRRPRGRARRHDDIVHVDRTDGRMNRAAV